jgi:diacylglycerol kinase family enzyme
MNERILNQSLDDQKRSLLLVGNPTSQSGKAKERIQKVCRLLTQMGINFVLKETLPYGETVKIVQNAINNEGFTDIVYLGGDGTFYEVAKGICESDSPQNVVLGMLPSGTANDQGKSFGISAADRDLENNINIILKRYVEPLDVGKVTACDIDGSTISTDLFFDSIGWGLSAAILAFRNKELKLVKKMPIWRDIYKNQAVYVRAAVHQLALKWLTGDRFSAEITVDDEVHNLHGLSDLVINNTMLYAGEWIVDPKSSHNDGIFEISPFSGVTDWTNKLIVYHKKNQVSLNLLNRIGIAPPAPLKGRNIEIQIFRPAVDKRLPSQRDGEEFVQADHFKITVLPGLLNIIVPQNFHWI